MQTTSRAYFVRRFHLVWWFEILARCVSLSFIVFQESNLDWYAMKQVDITPLSRVLLGNARRLGLRVDGIL
jgi:hypothetical protein